MASKSKNNPNARNKQDEVVRTCDICGTSGPIDKTVQRVMKAVGGKKKMIWRCKSACSK